MCGHLFWEENATRDDAMGTPNGVTHSKTGQRLCYHIYGRPASDADAGEVCFGGDRIPISMDAHPSDYEVDTLAMRENFSLVEECLPAMKLNDDFGSWCGVVGSSSHGAALVGEVSFLPGLWLCTGFGGSGFMQGIGAGRAISAWISRSPEASSDFAVSSLRAEFDPTPWIRVSAAAAAAQQMHCA
eukprot:TRINITY_DN45891_c0_g1_i1.p2 TRINITY_DN45891_c0_g1~~TRINITY_DN45891_c0_g1_i1.p2  ORF type:complete len:186 (+),score=41.08 TRINITY_DN45891_c0_g1_i1:457-1014(+)